MAMYGTPSRSSASNTVTTLSCEILAAARASRRNRSFALLSAANSGSITLNASRRSSRVSRAR